MSGSTSFSAFSVRSVTDLSSFAPQDKVEELRTELKNWQKLVKGNLRMLLGITDIASVDGSQLDSESCAPISDAVLTRINHHVANIILSGAELNGEPNNWSVGFMGSRWMDIPAKPFGLDYIRVAFYSKKHSEEWKHDKPYLIRIMCEKEA